MVEHDVITAPGREKILKTSSIRYIKLCRAILNRFSAMDFVVENVCSRRSAKVKHFNLMAYIEIYNQTYLVPRNWKSNSVIIVTRQSWSYWKRDGSIKVSFFLLKWTISNNSDNLHLRCCLCCQLLYHVKEVSILWRRKQQLKTASIVEENNNVVITTKWNPEIRIHFQYWRSSLQSHRINDNKVKRYEKRYNPFKLHLNDVHL